MTTIRSLEGLRLLLTPKRKPKAEPKEPSRPYLFIPCARCGRSLSYFDAVKTVTPGWAGFAHPDGGCNATDMTTHRLRISNIVRA